MGKYDKTNNTQLQDIFNTMTLTEKLVIKSLNFEFIWYHMFLTGEKSEIYYRCCTRFNNCFLVDNAKVLLSLLSLTKHIDETIWEPPKGRKLTSKEPNVACAIREVEEETRVVSEEYKIIPKKKHMHVINDDMMRYVEVYYVGCMTKKSEPTLQISDVAQVSEICAVKWVNISDVQKIPMYDETKHAIISMAKNLRKTAAQKIYFGEHVIYTNGMASDRNEIHASGSRDDLQCSGLDLSSL
jgi:8-oxo-dGTP pyrophosphatase MutT (NUDIX family)